METSAAPDRCSLRSLAADEPLAGTASTIRRWLLVTHDGPWGRDGLLDARLPRGLGGALRDVGRRSAARVLLIRRPGRSPEPGPVFVVGTHGRRDPCCAERGRPLAQALAAAAPTASWESTHVGGDRFAGNVVAFPEGITFGRLAPDEAAGLVTAFAEGRIAPIDRFRGRTRDPWDVQAAEGTLRIRLGLDGIDDLELRDRAVDGDASIVTFATPVGGHRVRLTRVAGPPMRLTCHSTREEIPMRWIPIEVDRAGDAG